MEIQELKPAVEALLFASDKPLTLIQLAQILEGAERKALRQALDELKADYDAESRGFRLSEIAEGWQVLSRPEHAAFIRRLHRQKTTHRFTRASLESLAIVAYKQPITKAELEAIRGVNSDAVLHGLLERRFIRTVGRKDAPGRPLLYGTTREFLMGFGLKDLSELPRLTELRDLLAQEPEGELWELGPDGRLVARRLEDFVQGSAEESEAATLVAAPGEHRGDDGGEGGGVGAPAGEGGSGGEGGGKDTGMPPPAKSPVP